MSSVAYVHPEKCDRSPMCPAKRMCPQNAITQEGASLFRGVTSKVDPGKCTGCSLCMQYCPARAIEMVNAQ